MEHRVLIDTKHHSDMRREGGSLTRNSVQIPQKKISVATVVREPKEAMRSRDRMGMLPRIRNSGVRSMYRRAVRSSRDAEYTL